MKGSLVSEALHRQVQNALKRSRVLPAKMGFLVIVSLKAQTQFPHRPTSMPTGTWSAIKVKLSPQDSVSKWAPAAGQDLSGLPKLVRS